MFSWMSKKLAENPKITFPRTKLASLQGTRTIHGNLGVSDGMKGYHSSIVEPLTELLGSSGAAIYNKMRKNDPVVGGLILLLESVIRRMTYEFSGDNAEFVKQMFEELNTPFESILSEIASFFTFGFYIGEKIWQVKDGKITLVDIEPRFQPTIEYINDENGLVGQTTGGGVYDIPYEKTLHIVVVNESRSPFGVSMLRHLYKPYYYKLSIEATEALSIDRDLGGLPVLKAPEGFDFTACDSSSANYDAVSAATLEWALQVVSSVRRDQQQGLVIPNGWEFSITRGENRASVPTSDIIARYNTEMATGVLANFLSLGAFATTNNANTQVHVSNFLGACEAYAKAVATAVQKQVVDVICRYNRIDKPPKFTLAVKNHNALKDVGTYIAGLVNAGVMHPTESVEKAVLALANIPYVEEEIKKAEKKAKANLPKPAQGDPNAQRNQVADNT